MHDSYQPEKRIEQKNGLKIEYFSYHEWRRCRQAFEGYKWDLVVFKDKPPEFLLAWVNMNVGYKFKGCLHLYNDKDAMGASR